MTDTAELFTGMQAINYKSDELLYFQSDHCSWFDPFWGGRLLSYLFATLPFLLSNWQAEIVWTHVDKVQWKACWAKQCDLILTCAKTVDDILYAYMVFSISFLQNT